MTDVDARLVERFVRIAADELEGDWVILGGGVLPLLGVEHRVTLDIDVAGPEGSTRDQALRLMEIAERLGLPVEAINQAGAYFLQRIEGWRDHLVLVREGATARIHRPDVTLFLLLKVGRLTVSDLADCIEMLRWAERRGERLDARLVIGAIDEALGTCESGGRRERLGRLRGILVEEGGTIR